MGNIRRIQRRYFYPMIKLIYPTRCVLCNEVISWKEEICDECRLRLSYVQSPYCLRCGKEIVDEEQEYCRDCEENPKSFLQGFPAMNYKDPLPDAIAAFKYHNRRQGAGYFARQIVRCRGEQILAANPEVLVPIPIHKRKKRQRGYNQAELLTRELGACLKIPVDTTILCRTQYTLPQKKLDAKSRELNLKKAFFSNERIVKYKSVMLVDDIYTTGATIEACTKLLKKHGVKDVYYTSICIGKGY